MVDEALGRVFFLSLAWLLCRTVCLYLVLRSISVSKDELSGDRRRDQSRRQWLRIAGARRLLDHAAFLDY